MLARLSSLVARGSAPAPGGAEAAFDYYIDPAGDDNNVGSLASPWSISALNSKRATYTGKRVGFLPGTYTQGKVGGSATTIKAALDAAPSPSTNGQAYILEGGTAGTPTYFGSSDSSGNYSPRTALIDATNGGTQSTNEAVLFGQYISGPTNFGYVTWDGISIKGATWAALAFYNTTSTPGITVKNSEFYNCVAPTTASNPGCIWLRKCPSGTYAAQILNCKFHDLTSSAGITPWGLYAILTFDSKGVIITNCKGEKCIGAYGKDGYQTCVMSYCYWDTGDFGSANQQWTIPAVRGFIPDVGETTDMNHNIIIGEYVAFGGDSSLVKGAMKTNHNTFYQTQNAEAALYAALDTGSSGSEFKDNLVYFTGTVSSDNTLCFRTSSAPNASRITVNYNAYASAAKFQPVEGTTFDLSLASFKTWNSQGQEANSISLGSSPFSTTPVTGSYTTFDITGTAATASSTGGKVGAVDGTGIVGTDW